jgi:hypothetical protein
MPVDQIEMLWRCGDKGCNHENRGRFHACERCGRPKGDEDGYYLPGDISHEAAVTDADQLRAALAGPDWRCKYCASMQRRLDGSCAQCGADQATGEKVREVTPEPTTVEREWEAELPRSPLPSRWAWLGLLLLIPLALWLLFRSHEYDATVTATSWRTSVHVEIYAPQGREGFNPDLDAVDVQNRGTRIHHYDHVRTGSHEEAYPVSEACGQTCSPVPRTCSTTPRSCRSNKNGYATCSGGNTVCSGGGQSCSVKYCSVTRHRTVDDYASVPRFQDYFAWTVWRWGHERDAVRVGDDVTPTWADPQVGDKEREAGRDMDLHARFAADGKTWDYAPRDVGELVRCATGSKHRIKVSVAGGVEILR